MHISISSTFPGPLQSVLRPRYITYFLKAFILQFSNLTFPKCTFPKFIFQSIFSRNVPRYASCKFCKFFVLFAPVLCTFWFLCLDLSSCVLMSSYWEGWRRELRWNCSGKSQPPLPPPLPLSAAWCKMYLSKLQNIFWNLDKYKYKYRYSYTHIECSLALLGLYWL